MKTDGKQQKLDKATQIKMRARRWWQVFKVLAATGGQTGGVIVIGR